MSVVATEGEPQVVVLLSLGGELAQEFAVVPLLCCGARDGNVELFELAALAVELPLEGGPIYHTPARDISPPRVSSNQNSGEALPHCEG